MSAAPAFLLARPRSGTTALRDAITSCSDVWAIGEIFSDDPETRPLPFIPWLAELLPRAPGRGVPTGANRAWLLKAYIRFLQTQMPDAHRASRTLLSVNYNSLHILNAVWQNSYDAPYLCRLLRDFRYDVIHLVRRNVLRTLVSERKARASNVWHRSAQDAGGAAAGPVRLDTEELLYELAMRRQEIALIERFFRGYDRLRTIAYEDLFDAGGMPNGAAIEDVLRFLGVAFIGTPRTRFRRTGGTALAEDVENWGDVVRMLEGTEFADMLG